MWCFPRCRVQKNGGIMKKKIIISALIAVTILLSVSCGSESKKEYDIEEFGKLYLETQELFEEETQYLTDEELAGDKGRNAYEKCSKKTGLPFNQSVTIRGKKKYTLRSSFYILSEDGEYSIPCLFEVDEPNISIFINDGENIVVSGIFSQENHGYGSLTNITIDSPKNIDTSYNNNIDNVLSQCADHFDSYVIHGEVDSIKTLEDFEYMMSLLSGTANYESQDYYYDTVVCLKDEDGEGTIYFMYDKDTFGELKPGDKVAVEGYVDDLMHLLKADKTIDVMSGFMGNIYTMYVF